MHRAHLRRSRYLVAIATGLALTATLSAAPATAQSPGFASQPRSTAEVAPLSADIEITRTVVDASGDRVVQQETNRFFRGSDGRTRTEAGSTVTIYDPTDQTTIVLDTDTRTYHERSRDTSSLRPQADLDITGNQQLSSPPRMLGRAVMEGVLAEGREYTVTSPTSAGMSGQEYVVTQWLSAEVQLPLRSRVQQPTGEVLEQAYTNLRVGVEPAGSLFEVPTGYRESDPTAAQPQAMCPVTWTSTVLLVSTGPFLGAGSVLAATDPGVGCLFIADAAVFELPLDGFPVTPLGLPVDEWFVFDTGLPVPFLPWVAFGFVGFVANDGSGDLTPVEALVILDIF